MSGGNDFGYFCANDSAVIEANVALTFSRGMGGASSLLCPSLRALTVVCSKTVDGVK